MNRFDSMLQMILQAIQGSFLEYLPPSHYRDFCFWALSHANPRRDEWLYLTAAPPLAKLAVTLLDGIVDDHRWPDAALYGVRISLYFSYEIVSDDLALGLARRSHDLACIDRRELLRHFNDAMLRRLDGATKTGAQLLEPARARSQRISGVEQNQTQEKYREILKLYVSEHPGVAWDDLDYSLFPRLGANIDTCAAVAERVAMNPLGPVVLEGLRERYRAVNALLDEPDMTLAKRVSVGIGSVSVIPTLAYYMAMLVDVAGRPREFDRVLESGLLTRALQNAALIVRLLNDVGTGLLTQSAPERTALLRELRTQGRGDAAGSVTELLLASAYRHKQLLCRIDKDLMCGEFNMCLDGIDTTSSIDEALSLFEHRLDRFADLYRTGMRELDAQLITMEQMLDPRMSALVRRFVVFHEQMYGQAHDHAAGEYRT